MTTMKKILLVGIGIVVLAGGTLWLSSNSGTIGDLAVNQDLSEWHTAHIEGEDLVYQNHRHDFSLKVTKPSFTVRADWIQGTTRKSDPLISYVERPAIGSPQREMRLWVSFWREGGRDAWAPQDRSDFKPAEELTITGVNGRIEYRKEGADTVPYPSHTILYRSDAIDGRYRIELKMRGVPNTEASKYEKKMKRVIRSLSF